MNLQQFLKMSADEIMTHEEAGLLNEDLATKSVSNIPEQKNRAMVADYLVTALNMNSIEHDLVPSLELLLTTLQETA